LTELLDLACVARTQRQRDLPKAVYLQARIDKEVVGISPRKVAAGLDAVEATEKIAPPRRPFS
jgi:hypothetical protein